MGRAMSHARARSRDAHSGVPSDDRHRGHSIAWRERAGSVAAQRRSKIWGTGAIGEILRRGHAAAALDDALTARRTTSEDRLQEI